MQEGFRFPTAVEFASFMTAASVPAGAIPVALRCDRRRIRPRRHPPRFRAWERAYNTVPAHQSLGYLTPAECPLGSHRCVTEVLHEYTGLTWSAWPARLRG